MKKEIVIRNAGKAMFNNRSGYCVGTGRMGLALHKEYYDQLKMAQETAGFRFIRGHGLFCEDMGIYQYWKDPMGNEYKGYNFTYLDRVMDSYMELGIRPFLELGFMPKAIASGEQTIFYWHGNTTPPKAEEEWCELIRTTLRHLAERYGTEEVSAWPCEIWNEPNLPGFWENADEDKYHRLYEISVQAVKSVLPEMRVGGPAICGGNGSQDWIRNFLTFCRDKKLPVDFVTRHAYMGNTPEHQGRYLYHEMRSIDDLMEEMTESRRIIDSFPEYCGKDMYITEFNTSYNPFCPIHDTNLNAAYTAALLSRLGDVASGYSYWTFGDVFEEQGIPARPFHGGFGMIANGLIAKPTLWAFSFFTRLRGTCVYRDENAVIMKRENGDYEGVLWNLCREKREKKEITIYLPEHGEYAAVLRTVDEQTCNPLKVWHDLGEPESPDSETMQILRESGKPEVSSIVIEGKDSIAVPVTIRENGVIHISVRKRVQESESGYDYDWYRKHS